MATAAAAIIAKTQQDMINRFTEAEATSPGRAVAWEPGGKWPAKSIATTLIRTGVIVEGPVGKYYVDLDALALHRRSRRRLAIAMLIGSLAATAALIAIG